MYAMESNETDDALKFIVYSPLNDLMNLTKTQLGTPVSFERYKVQLMVSCRDEELLIIESASYNGYATKNPIWINTVTS